MATNVYLRSETIYYNTVSPTTRWGYYSSFTTFGAGWAYFTSEDALERAFRFIKTELQKELGQKLVDDRLIQLLMGVVWGEAESDKACVKMSIGETWVELWPRIRQTKLFEKLTNHELVNEDGPIPPDRPSETGLAQERTRDGNAEG
jgi:hypothetical protein